MNVLRRWAGRTAGTWIRGTNSGNIQALCLLLLRIVVVGAALLLWRAGEAGPGDSYNDPGSGGPENAWTTRNTVFMTWNLLHLARMLKDAGGIPAYGNDTRQWDLSQPDHPNPEYR